MRPLVVGRLASGGIAPCGFLVELSPDRTQACLALLLGFGPRCGSSCGCGSGLSGRLLSRRFLACGLGACGLLTRSLLANSFLTRRFLTRRFKTR